MTASFALHVVVALFVLWPSRAPQIPAPVSPPPIQVIALSNPKSGALLETQSAAPECLQGKVYMGIGMQYTPNEIVTVAPASYPAYKAGIRLGDEVLNPEFEPDVHGYDVVDFKRHGTRHRLRIKTQWICLR